VDIEAIKQLIRDVPDFPEPGIVFKDITPVLADPIAFSTIIAWSCSSVMPASLRAGIT